MSEVSDLSFVVDDGVLSESYSIARLSGTFQIGGFHTTETIIPGWGVVSVASPQDLEMIPEGDQVTGASPQDLEMIPEGDQVTGAMVFHSMDRIFETQKDVNPVPNGTQYVSDQLIWEFQRWRVLKVFPYPNRTFWKAIAVRMQGN
jgi:hypothetical protein